MEESRQADGGEGKGIIQHYSWRAQDLWEDPVSGGRMELRRTPLQEGGIMADTEGTDIFRDKGVWGTTHIRVQTVIRHEPVPRGHLAIITPSYWRNIAEKQRLTGLMPCLLCGERKVHPVLARRGTIF